MMSSGAGDEDFLDLILRLEDTHLRQGFDDGYAAGLLSGRQDARHLGLKLGFETGELLGFYRGCSSLWNSPPLLLHFSPQLRKHLSDFQALLDQFPLFDPQDESKDEIKDDLRLKFNIICASLGISKKQFEYKGYPKPSSNLDF